MADASDTKLVSWEELYGHPLTEAEHKEIQQNLCAFFKLLNDWQASE